MIRRWAGRWRYSVAILALRIGFVDFVAMEVALCQDMVDRNFEYSADLVVMDVVVCLARYSPANCFGLVVAVDVVECLDLRSDRRCSSCSWTACSAVDSVVLGSAAVILDSAAVSDCRADTVVEAMLENIALLECLRFRAVRTFAKQDAAAGIPCRPKVQHGRSVLAASMAADKGCSAGVDSCKSLAFRRQSSFAQWVAQLQCVYNRDLGSLVVGAKVRTTKERLRKAHKRSSERSQPGQHRDSDQSPLSRRQAIFEVVTSQIPD